MDAKQAKMVEISKTAAMVATRKQVNPMIEWAISLVAGVDLSPWLQGRPHLNTTSGK